MRAIAIHDFGGAPTLTDVPDPAPAAGEVLVRVRASSVNGFDTAAAGGMLRDVMEHRFPAVLGKDFAGTVEAVGEQATRFAVGDEVFGVVMKPYLGEGGLGEHLAVSDSYGVTSVPGGVSTKDAGALGLAGTAALTAVDAVAPQAGERVFVAGATGGVGGYAIQLAVERGAEVIATATPGAKEEFVRDLGATHTVDYSGDVPGQVRAIAPEGVPAAVHLAGHGGAVAGVLAPGGRFATTLGYGPEAAGRTDVKVTAVLADPQPSTLDRLAAEVAAGRLRVPVTRSYPLAEAPRAFADFDGGTVGKLAVAVA
jgi:NADPH:quinone reductase-like Zn-dependent oxidoreductase